MSTMTVEYVGGSLDGGREVWPTTVAEIVHDITPAPTFVRYVGDFPVTREKLLERYRIARRTDGKIVALFYTVEKVQ